MSYSPWGHKELDTAKQLHFHFILVILSGCAVGAQCGFEDEIAGWHHRLDGREFE